MPVIFILSLVTYGNTHILRMAFTAISLFLAALGVINTAFAQSAVIGPVTDLDIINAEVNLDGFPRQAVLAGGTFPGPLIKGNKVGLKVLILPILD